MRKNIAMFFSSICEAMAHRSILSLPLPLNRKKSLIATAMLRPTLFQGLYVFSFTPTLCLSPSVCVLHIHVRLKVSTKTMTGNSI